MSWVKPSGTAAPVLSSSLCDYSHPFALSVSSIIFLIFPFYSPFLVSIVTLNLSRSLLWCQTPSKTQTNGQTDRHREPNLVRFDLKMRRLAAVIFPTFNRPNFVYVLVDSGFLFLPAPPVNFYEASRFVHPEDGRPWQTQRTNGHDSLAGCLSVCVLNRVWHIRRRWECSEDGVSE